MKIFYGPLGFLVGNFLLAPFRGLLDLFRNGVNALDNLVQRAAQLNLQLRYGQRGVEDFQRTWDRFLVSLTQPIFDVIADQLERATGGFENFQTTLGSYARAGGEFIADGVRQALDYLQSLVDGGAGGFDPQRFFVAGARIAAEFVNGLLSGFLNAIPILTQAVQTVADFLIGRSPPPRGPLTQIVQGGKNVVESWLAGFLQADFSALDALTNLVRTKLQIDLFEGRLKQPSQVLEGVQAGARLIEQALAEITTNGSAANATVAQLQELFGDAWTEAKNVLDAVTSLRAAQEGANDAVRGASALYEAARQKVDAIRDAVQQQVAAAQDAVRAAQASLQDVRAAVQAQVDAAQDAVRAAQAILKSVQDAVAEQVRAAQDKVREAQALVDAIQDRIRKFEMDSAEIPERFTRGRRRELDEELLAAQKRVKLAQDYVDEVRRAGEEQIRAAQAGVDAAQAQLDATRKAGEQQIKNAQAVVDAAQKQLDATREAGQKRVEVAEKELDAARKAKEAADKQLQNARQQLSLAEQLLQKRIQELQLQQQIAAAKAGEPSPLPTDPDKYAAALEFFKNIQEQLEIMRPNLERLGALIKGLLGIEIELPQGYGAGSLSDESKALKEANERGLALREALFGENGLVTGFAKLAENVVKFFQALADGWNGLPEPLRKFLLSPQGLVTALTAKIVLDVVGTPLGLALLKLAAGAVTGTAAAAGIPVVLLVSVAIGTAGLLWFKEYVESGKIAEIPVALKITPPEQLTLNTGVIEAIVAWLEGEKIGARAWTNILVGLTEAIGDPKTGALNVDWEKIFGFVDFVGKVKQFFDDPLGFIQGKYKNKDGGKLGTAGAIGALLPDEKEIQAQANALVGGIVTALNARTGEIKVAAEAGAQGVTEAWQKTFDTVVGNSIVPDLVRNVGAYLVTLRDDAIRLTSELVGGMVGEFNLLPSGITLALNATAKNIYAFIENIQNAWARFLEWLVAGGQATFSALLNNSTPPPTTAPNESSARPAVNRAENFVRRIGELTATPRLSERFALESNLARTHREYQARVAQNETASAQGIQMQNTLVFNFPEGTPIWDRDELKEKVSDGAYDALNRIIKSQRGK